ncbi:MAG: adenylate kinase family protein [Candidatus Nitrosocosmicus sp.]
MKIIISGTPGVGKHTVSIELSKMWNGFSILDINKVILSKNLFISSESKNEIDLKKTFDLLKSLLFTKEYHNSIIVGHLAPYVIDPSLIDFVVILRRNPFELKKVYQERSYSKKKIHDNLVSEILGIISHDFLEKFDRKDISELEINGNVLPSFYAEKITDMYNNKALREFGMIDWLPLIQNNPQTFKFMF